ncbi:MAG: hypothetical protein SF066_01310 [Thermoanaerobaculia bacterium]|nr:hypothetical protein [Thermoanaerobaculia bacterium]
MSKNASHRASKSNLAQVDAHAIAPEEYDELPELTAEMLSRAVVRRGGRPSSANPRKLITLALRGLNPAEPEGKGIGSSSRTH